MDNRRWRRRLMALALALCVCLAALPVLAEGTPGEVPGMTVKEWRKARVYMGTLDSVYTLSTWEFEEQEDVPYISLREYLDLLFVDNYDPGLDYSWDGDVLMVTRNGMSVCVDTDAQTVRCENWRVFLGPHAAGAIPDGIVEKEEFLAIRPSVKNESTQTPTKGFEVNLQDYGVEMIRVNEDVLMPFAIAQAVFAGPAQRSVLAYNGDDYFDIVNSVDYIYGTMTAAPNPYANMWYSGRFANRKQLSEAYARYNYAAMCLLLDVTYGHKEEKGIQNFDSYMEANDLKAPLLTPDPKDDVEPLTKLFNMLFDSGHDAQLLTPSIIDSDGAIQRADKLHKLLSYVGYDNLADLTNDLTPVLTGLMKLFPDLFDKKMDDAKEALDSEHGPNVSKLLDNSLRMQMLKPFGYGSGRVDIVGDTCIIYFDGFKENLTRSESFYTKLPTKQDLETSTFGLFYYAFEKIKADGNVKNVVFDLCDNGGGSAAALVATLGFLSEDGEVCLTYRDLLNQDYCTEYYHVDTNLDGRFDNNDGYGGQYNFYILTTGLAYSCGNAFPYFAQKAGQAKIIGEKPGGGDCVVARYVDAYGHVGAISGFKKLGTMEGDTFISDETAVEVDYPISVEEGNEIYFHPKKIAKFVDGLADGGDENAVEDAGIETPPPAPAPTAQELAEGYFNVVSGIEFATAGASLKTAVAASEVCAFAVKHDLYNPDTEPLAANLRAAYEGMGEDERAAFWEGFDAVRTLVDDYLAEGKDSHAVLEDAGVADAMDEMMSDPLSRQAWENLRDQTMGLK